MNSLLSVESVGRLGRLILISAGREKERRKRLFIKHSLKEVSFKSKPVSFGSVVDYVARLGTLVGLP